MRYEIVRDIPDDWGVVVVERHPEQPEDGFASAVEAHLWSERIPRDLKDNGRGCVGFCREFNYHFFCLRCRHP
jgi:hypothetical protein